MRISDWSSDVCSSDLIRPGGRGTRPRIDSAVMLFPQPDSPTTPSVSPDHSCRETSSTARTTPVLVRNCVLRFRTSSTGTGASGLVGAFTGMGSPRSREPGVKHVAQPVAHQVDRQNGDRQEHARDQDYPGSHLKVDAALGHDVSPARDFRRSRSEEHTSELQSLMRISYAVFC